MNEPPKDDTRAPGVQIVDAPTARVHDPSDLLGLVLSAVGVLAVLVAVVSAQGTTAGVAQDVRGFSWLLRRVLVFPVAVLEGLVTLIAPVAVLAELAVRRNGRQLLQVGAAGLVALALCVATTAALTAFGSAELLHGLSVSRDGRWVLSVPASVAALAGVLTAAGPRARRRTVLWSWNLLWFSLGVVLVTGQVSLSGAAVALLLGRVAGLGVRFVSGVRSERAYGAALVAGIRRAGFDPARLVRVGDADEHRMYDLTTAAGQGLRVVVLDGDRQVVGALSRLWRSVRLRGIEGRSLVSLRQAVERTALLAYAARAAGVRTPQPLGIAEAQDSMLVIEALTGAVPLRLVDDAQLSDELLHAIWGQLRSAHDAGIAHRALTSDTILVELGAGEPVVWLVGWDSGDVASTELARRMDLTQLVALLAVRVGAARALESAAAVLPRQDLAAIGPLLQSVVLPQRTRDEMRAHPGLLAQLRSALVERLPGTDVEPEQVTRFGVRTVLTVVLPVVAVVVILTSINVDEIGTALTSSDWRWSAVAFGLGLATYVGAGLTFAAFAPVKVSLRSATLVHAVGAFVSLAAPAGVGSAALNLRLLTRRGVSTSLAVATVALVQVSQFIVTIALLLLLSLVSGSNDTSLFAPGPGALVAIGVVALALAAALLFPGVRRWAVRTSMPTVRQTWPRLVDVLGHPGRVALAILGNVMLTMGYVLAFDASLAAFGQHRGIVEVAVIYLVGNAAGAAIPTPGGIGTIEVTLIGGLTAAGMNPGVAASAVVLFRLLTFWLPIPLGWLAMRHMRRTGEL
ncbi:lysylphosphatidylglycerol synthase transmembrane domain-containing protein [Cellulomonas sp. WB94]|uniref:lysylphosphatidylglycerol synthase transmembrane domain-containing protein n=1 Tax=Cellulomonas sp. WB94 TaxID=2173174 RepID=UPI001F5B50C7|nr:lysylphosphatidylglycerol synthase transmembrane domain-containing protein [Cellulomonas sp. WB94]